MLALQQHASLCLPHDLSTLVADLRIGHKGVLDHTRWNFSWEGVLSCLPFFFCPPPPPPAILLLGWSQAACAERAGNWLLRIRQSTRTFADNFSFASPSSVLLLSRAVTTLATHDAAVHSHANDVGRWQDIRFARNELQVLKQTNDRLQKDHKDMESKYELLAKEHKVGALRQLSVCALLERLSFQNLAQGSCMRRSHACTILT